MHESHLGHARGSSPVAGSSLVPQEGVGVQVDAARQSSHARARARHCVAPAGHPYRSAQQAVRCELEQKEMHAPYQAKESQPGSLVGRVSGHS